MADTVGWIVLGLFLAGIAYWTWPEPQTRDYRAMTKQEFEEAVRRYNESRAWRYEDPISLEEARGG